MAFAAGTSVFAQTRTFSPVTVDHVSRPVSASRSTTCNADTLRYALVKEYAFNATPAFYALPIHPAEEQSQAFVSPGTVSIVGVDFRAKADPSNPTATIPVKVYLYSVDASYKPVARMDSASLNVATTSAIYYHANFSAPHSVTGNYAVVVASAGAFIVDVISNARDAGTGGEGLSYNRWDSGAGLTWYPNSDASDGWGQDFDADINPVVSYAINTDYTVSPSSPVCAGTTLSFTNTTTPMNTLSTRMYSYNAFLYYFGGSTSDSTYAWDMDDGSAIIWSQDATYAYPAAGTYNATLYTLSGFWNSCTDTKQTSITVNAIPALNITSPAPACAPATVDITAAAVTAGSTGGGTLTYWTDAAATSALASPSAVSASGTYYIQATNGSCSDIQPVTVTINAEEDATITDPGMICDNAAAFNLAAATSGGTWSGTGITDGSNGTFDPAVAGAGTTTITYTTGGACPGTDMITLTVSVCTGIQSYDNAAGVSVYPNPSTGMVNVNTGAAGKSVVVVYNVIGEVVFSKEFNTASNTIDLAAFGTGIYSVKVTTDKNITVKKVMVTK